MSGRFAILVLAPRRAAWADRLAGWAADGTVSMEFLRCQSPEEVRARLLTPRRHAALLIDDGAGPDRDLLATAASAGCVPFVVRRSRRDTSWISLGAAADLDEDFGPAELAAHLEVVARPVTADAGAASAARGSGHVVAVCGSGGTGVSTVAAALAQGLADRWGETVLADLARHGEQAMLHDVPARIPGVEALVEAHRNSTPDLEAVRSFAHSAEARGYDLLVGLRRARAWSVLRPRAVEAALASLRVAYDVVVCDTEPDLEGEDEGGSLDVEERNALARAAVSSATVVVVVAIAGLKGTHSLVRVLGDVWSHGAEPARTVIMVNRTNDQSSGETIVTALGRLLSDTDLRGMPKPVLVGEHSAVEQDFVTGTPLPAGVVEPVTAAVVAALDSSRLRQPVSVPERVAPGSLATWDPADDG